MPYTHLSDVPWSLAACFFLSPRSPPSPRVCSEFTELVINSSTHRFYHECHHARCSGSFAQSMSSSLSLGDTSSHSSASNLDPSLPGNPIHHVLLELFILFSSPFALPSVLCFFFILLSHAFVMSLRSHTSGFLQISSADQSTFEQRSNMRTTFASFMLVFVNPLKWNRLCLEPAIVPVGYTALKCSNLTA